MTKVKVAKSWSFCRMDSPEDLYESGLFINDLAMYDSSRDSILAGSQKDPELKIALSQVMHVLSWAV